MTTRNQIISHLWNIVNPDVNGLPIGLNNVTQGTSDPSVAPALTPCLYINITNNTLWYWPVSGTKWTSLGSGGGGGGDVIVNNNAPAWKYNVSGKAPLQNQKVWQFQMDSSGATTTNPLVANISGSGIAFQGSVVGGLSSAVNFGLHTVVLTVSGSVGASPTWSDVVWNGMQLILNAGDVSTSTPQFPPYAKVNPSFTVVSGAGATPYYTPIGSVPYSVTGVSYDSNTSYPYRIVYSTNTTGINQGDSVLIYYTDSGNVTHAEFMGVYTVANVLSSSYVSVDYPSSPGALPNVPSDIAKFRIQKVVSGYLTTANATWDSNSKMVATIPEGVWSKNSYVDYPAGVTLPTSTQVWRYTRFGSLGNNAGSTVVTGVDYYFPDFANPQSPPDYRNSTTIEIGSTTVTPTLQQVVTAGNTLASNIDITDNTARVYYATTPTFNSGDSNALVTKAYVDASGNGVTSFAKTGGALHRGAISLTQGSNMFITDNSDGSFTLAAASTAITLRDTSSNGTIVATYNNISEIRFGAALTAESPSAGVVLIKPELRGNDPSYVWSFNNRFYVNQPSTVAGGGQFTITATSVTFTNGAPYIGLTDGDVLTVTSDIYETAIGAIVDQFTAIGSYRSSDTSLQSVVFSRSPIDTTNAYTGTVGRMTQLTLPAAGSNTQLQYNNNGVFASIPSLTYNGTNVSLSVAPTLPAHVARLSEVEAAITGITPLPPVRAVSVSPVAGVYTINSWTTQPVATFVPQGGVLNVDGISTWALNDRVLFTAQDATSGAAAGLANGAFVVTSLAPLTLSRPTTVIKFGNTYPVTAGTLYQGSSWFNTTGGTITATTPLTYAELTAPNSIAFTGYVVPSTAGTTLAANASAGQNSITITGHAAAAGITANSIIVLNTVSGTRFQVSTITIGATNDLLTLYTVLDGNYPSGTNVFVRMQQQLAIKNLDIGTDFDIRYSSATQTGTLSISQRDAQDGWLQTFYEGVNVYSPIIKFTGNVRAPTSTMTVGSGAGYVNFSAAGTANLILTASGGVVQVAKPLTLSSSFSGTPTLNVPLRCADASAATLSDGNSGDYLRSRGSNLSPQWLKGPGLDDVTAIGAVSTRAFSAQAPNNFGVQLQTTATAGIVSAMTYGAVTDAPLTLTSLGAAPVNVSNTGGLLVGSNLANQVRLFGGAAGVAPSITVTGSDTNANLHLVPLGAGRVSVADGTGLQLGSSLYNAPLYAGNAATPTAFSAGSLGSVLASRGIGTPYWATPGSATFSSYYNSSVLVSGSSDNLLIWSINPVNNLNLLTHNTGVFTATRAVTVAFTYGVAATGLVNATEFDIWFSYNGIVGTGTRLAQVNKLGSLGSSQILSTTLIYRMNANDTIRCYFWANSTASYQVGNGAPFGGVQTRINVVELTG